MGNFLGCNDNKQQTFQSKNMIDLQKISNVSDDIIQELKRTVIRGTRYCRVCSVYDGDTLDLAFYENNVLVRYKCRLAAIDTPELKSVDAEIKDVAYRAKDYLNTRVKKDPKAILYVEFIDSDKYGRPLVILYDKNIKEVNFIRSINNELITNGLAKRYSLTFQ